MQTYSHLLLTAVARDQIRQRKEIDPGKAFLLGSILPDIPLTLITIVYIIYWQINPNTPNEFIFGTNYDRLYFTNPWWITAYNLFHSPLLILLYGGLGLWLTKQVTPARQKWGWMLFWLAAGCGLHSLIDIFTHVNDGPLLFFPLNWTFRFNSPISYWDPEHGGRIFAPIEHLLDVGMLVYLIIRWRLTRQQKQPTSDI